MQGRSFEVKALDGRALWVRVAGPESGGAIIYHSGTPGTEYVYPRMLEVGAELGLRHICIRRPGYGRSDRQPNRPIAAIADDVTAVADALSVERFYVVGHSGGAAYALACAALMEDRVLAAAAISGFASPRAMGPKWRDGVNEGNVEEIEAAQGDEDKLARIIEEHLDKWRQMTSPSDPATALEEFHSETDQEAEGVGPLARYQLDCMLQIADEPIWGWFDDNRSVVADWGFALGQIQVPVSVWVGAADPSSPVAHSAWMAAQIPTARLRHLDGEGHVSLMEYHYDAMLDELIELGAERR